MRVANASGITPSLIKTYNNLWSKENHKDQSDDLTSTNYTLCSLTHVVQNVAVAI